MPKIIIKSKLQRYELNNSGRLKVDPMQVCLPKFWKAQSSGSKTNEEKRNDQLLCTFSNSRHLFEVPLQIETFTIVLLQSNSIVLYPVKISGKNSKNSSFYGCSKIEVTFFPFSLAHPVDIRSQ